jgi:hypothetical protein
MEVNMSGAQKTKSHPNELTESSGIIADKGVKDPDYDSGKHKKSVANGVDRQEMIATAAYYRAENRGLNYGDEIQDWLEAEKEIDNRL